MKIVVIGGTGLIGSKVVTQAHRARPRGRPGLAATRASTRSPARASPRRSTARAVVVDVSNSPNFEYATALDVLRDLDPQPAGRGDGGGRRPPRRAVGRRHPGAVRGRRPHEDDRRLLPARSSSQEALIQTSGIPYSIVHATQFFEFIKSIADVATDGDTVRAATGRASSRWRPPTSPRPSRRVAVGRAGQRHRRGRRARDIPCSTSSIRRALAAHGRPTARSSPTRLRPTTASP